MVVSLRKIVFSTLLALTTINAFANTPPAPLYCGFNCRGIVLQAGLYSSSPGRSQDIDIVGLTGDHFSVDHHNQWNYLLGLGYFINGYDLCPYSLMYGINAFYLAHVTVKGRITQEQLFTNLRYRYEITNIPIYAMLKGVLHYDMGDVLIDVGIGPNIVHTGDYRDRPLDHGITIPDRAFKGQTETEFSATFGIGFRFNNGFADCYPLEIGYRFFYLGESHLKKRSGQIQDKLKTSTNFANAFVLSTYF